MSLPELKRAICPGCGVDLYLHRVEDYWQCPECRWNDKPLPSAEGKDRQLTLLVNERYTMPQIAQVMGVHRDTVKRWMRSLGLRSLNGVGGGNRSQFCRSGRHEMEGFNVYLDHRGGRKCRACREEYARSRRRQSGVVA